MSFKIIQELNKRNCNVLTIIPAAFENNGVYWFPPKQWSTRKLNTVLRNPFAQPDISTWDARPCVVKKSSIETLALAEQYEEELIHKRITDCEEDADVESEASYPYAENTKRMSKTTRSPQADFNSVLHECLHSMSNSNPGIDNENIESDLLLNPNLDISSTIGDLNSPDVILSGNCFDNTNNKPSMLNNSLQSQEYEGVVISLLENQEKIFQAITDLKEIVTSGMAKLLAQTECFLTIKSTQLNVEEKKRNIEAAENFEKIVSAERANEVEKQLFDENFKTELIRKMSFVIGKNGKRSGEGWTCCYELIDLIFERSFLKVCSWTGASTSKVEEGKIPFFKFKNILTLFATVVSDADPDFSFEKTKEFFKKILRNATRFHSQEISQTRKSTKRERGAKKQIVDSQSQAIQSNYHNLSKNAENQAKIPLTSPT